MHECDYTYTAVIKGSQADVWDAIVNPAQTVRYFYDTAVESDWQAGSTLNYRHPATGKLVSTGEIIAIDAPNSLEIDFHARWDPVLEAEGPVREIWRLTPMDGLTSLTVELYGAPPGSNTLDDFATGFPFIISGLKTLVETGEPMGG